MFAVFIVDGAEVIPFDGVYPTCTAAVQELWTYKRNVGASTHPIVRYMQLHFELHFDDKPFFMILEV